MHVSTVHRTGVLCDGGSSSTSCCGTSPTVRTGAAPPAFHCTMHAAQPAHTLPWFHASLNCVAEQCLQRCLFAADAMLPDKRPRGLPHTPTHTPPHTDTHTATRLAPPRGLCEHPHWGGGEPNTNSSAGPGWCSGAGDPGISGATAGGLGGDGGGDRVGARVLHLRSRQGAAHEAVWRLFRWVVCCGIVVLARG